MNRLFSTVKVERNDDGDSFVNLMGKFGSIGFNRNLDNYVTSLKAVKGHFSKLTFSFKRQIHGLKQACTTYGPRAKCGPQKLLIWPAKLCF